MNDAPKLTRGRRRLLGCVTVALALVVVLVLLEIAARVAVAATIGRPRVEYDPRWGWRSTPNYDRTFTVRDADGTTREVRYRTDAHGSRGAPPASGGRPAVFVVGDSYTQATDASDGQTWYDALGQGLDMPVHAYGVSGYGTLQAYLVLDHWLAARDPDLVIVQVCANDFADNHFPLERHAWASNIGRLRPYWEDARVVWRVPLPGGRAVDLLARHSYLGRTLVYRLRHLLAGRLGGTPGDPAWEGQARAVTGELLGRIRERCGERTVVLVPFGEPGTAADAWRDLVAAHGLTLVDGLDAALAAADPGGTTYRAADGAHLNERGNRFAGAWLAAELQRRGIAARVEERARARLAEGYLPPKRVEPAVGAAPPATSAAPGSDVP